MTPKNWKPQKLKELGFVGRGKSKHRPRNEPSLYGGKYPFVQTGDIKAAELYLREYSQTYNDKGLAQSKLWKSGTLCITIAANIAETAILGMEACFPDSVVGFVADENKSDVRFVKYYIDTIKLRMQNISQGTTQDNLSLEKLNTFDVVTPPLPTQRRIADILSAYDDLIENNTRRIRILEGMAQAIYQEWFGKVDKESLPKGWTAGKLSDLADLIRDTTNAGQHLENIPYIPIDIIPRHSLALIESKPGSEAQSSLILFDKDDILFGAMRSYFHKVIVAPFNGVTRQTCFVLRPKSQEYYSFAVMTLFQDSTVAYSHAHARGSTMPYAVWDGSLSEMPVSFPPKNKASEFNKVIKPILEIIQLAYFRQNNLRQTRDLLLPRLVGGEIEVSTLS